MDDGDLAGFRVGVTADRRAAEQIELLQRRGATVVAAPVIRTAALGPEDGLRKATDAVLTGGPDVVVVLTAVGMRGWLVAAEAWGVDAELLEVLGRARIVARGPKVVGALRAIGLEPGWQAPGETLAEVEAHLLGGRLEGRRVIVQLPGDDIPSTVARLARAGADIVEVPVYRSHLPDDPAPAQALIERVLARDVDAVTFTVSAALRNMFALTDSAAAAERLREALASDVLCVVVGPVCATTARDLGIPEPLQPTRARLGAMIRTLTDRLRDERRVLRFPAGELVLAGGATLIDGRSVPLAPRERALLGILVERLGVPVSRQVLLRRVWGPGADDEHVVEVTVARLRSRLGALGSAVVTVPRRGYRLEEAATATPTADAGTG